MLRNLSATRIVLALAISVGLVFSLTLIPMPVVDIFQPSNQAPVAIEDQISQSFEAPQDGLSSVGFFFAFDTFDRRAKARLLLFEKGSSEPLRVAMKSVKAERRIPPPIIRPTYFDFAPVPDSGSKLFKAVLEVDGSGVSAMRAAGETYLQGAATVQNMPTTFDMAFATRHRGNLGDGLENLGRWIHPVLALGLLIAMAWCTLLASLAAAAAR